jgi:1-phosphofructokinase family hexose kinase
MKIITLTLNPAIDMHCYAENFEPFHENLASITSLDAGGKGVNISRALVENGVDNLALVVLGEENGASFASSLKADGMKLAEIYVDGRIRENITLHTNNAPETRISFSGFVATDALIDKVEELLCDVDSDTVVTLTGSNPKGITIERVMTMVKNFQAKGAKVIIDSRSFSKDNLFASNPWLIKPNEEEISMYTDIEVTDFASAAIAAKQIRAMGVENVMISSSKGAVLACAEGTFVAYAPKIKVASTIGAGDSSIAGFLAAATAGKSYAEMLRNAVAFGSAACTTEGTRPPLADVVASCLADTVVEAI